MLAVYDADSSSELDLAEFVTLVSEIRVLAQKRAEEEALVPADVRSAFERIDISKDGTISKRELAPALVQLGLDGSKEWAKQAPAPAHTRFLCA